MRGFRKQLEKKQVELIKEKEVFNGALGGGLFRNNSYPHILEEGKEWNNLYPLIRDNVKAYFSNNKIAFWGGKTITPNTLSSQVCCLNHLFLLREDKEVVKKVMQTLVGDNLHIQTMEIVNSKKELYNPQYIAFEMVSDEDRLNEGKPTRGNTCTSIDAFAIAKDNNGKRIMIVIEWKLVEDDSGNKAPDSCTSNNNKAINSGNKRVLKYKQLINGCNAINDKYKYTECYNSSIFHLPFYELMRQTLWANINKIDFNADDYLHLNVIPLNNPMRDKKYNCVPSTGIVDGWRKHLSDFGKKRYIDADPYLIIKALKDNLLNQYSDLIDYLTKRYYTI